MWLIAHTIQAMGHYYAPDSVWRNALATNSSQ
jgi:hypothetical protein